MTNLHPLSTSLVRGDTGTLRFEAIDIDLVAARVFAKIDELNLGEARDAIAARFAAFQGQPELEESLRASLASAYASTKPLRVFPPPPRIDVSARAVPLPPDPTFADLTQWTLAWKVEGELADVDVVGTELVVAEENVSIAVDEAHAFDIALVAFDADPTPENAAKLAAAIIEPHAPIDIAPLSGPTSGEQQFDLLAQPRMGVRATLVRNGDFAPEDRYAVTVTSAPVSPVIDRSHVEFALDTLDAITPLQPTRVAVYFNLLPVLLVIDSWDTREVGRVMDQWWESEGRPEGRYTLDVEGRGLRLRFSVRRP